VPGGDERAQDQRVVGAVADVGRVAAETVEEVLDGRGVAGARMSRGPDRVLDVGEPDHDVHGPRAQFLQGGRGLALEDLDVQVRRHLCQRGERRRQQRQRGGLHERHPHLPAVFRLVVTVAAPRIGTPLAVLAAAGVCLATGALTWRAILSTRRDGSA